MQLKFTDKCIIIAEIAQAHDGSLGMAHAYIDAIANTGANAVKFQTHIAAAESTIHEPWRIKFSQQDETRYDYWKRMEFTENQWVGLKKHAEDKGLFFISSPFSLEAVDLLARIGVNAWKIASGEVTNTPMFEKIANTGTPILLSTGMSRINEIDETVKLIKEKNTEFAILQCTSMYPTPPDKIGLNLLNLFHERYNCSVGLSDHSGSIFSSLAAVSLGAKIIEVHVTFHNQMFGPDVPASITIEELNELVKGIRSIEESINNPVDKDEMADELSSMRSLFMKSIVAKTDIPADTYITEDLITFKKPGTGIPSAQFEKINGRKIKKSLSQDELLTLDHLY